jgi:hypothetical protein
VRHEKALKGHFSKGTAAPLIAFFMDSSPIEDSAFIGEARVFMKTTNITVTNALKAFTFLLKSIKDSI